MSCITITILCNEFLSSYLKSPYANLPRLLHSIDTPETFSLVSLHLFVGQLVSWSIRTARQNESFVGSHSIITIAADQGGNAMTDRITVTLKKHSMMEIVVIYKQAMIDL